VLAWESLFEGSGLYRREAKAIGIVGSCENCDAVGISGGDVLIFVRVNQVLVRLWACLLACLTGCAVLCGAAASEWGVFRDAVVCTPPV
jgi:hypothetical protein